MSCMWLHCSKTITYFPQNILPVMHINEQSGKKKQVFDISKRLSTLCQQQKVSHSFFLSKELFTYIVGVNGSREGQNYVLMQKSGLGAAVT